MNNINRPELQSQDYDILDVIPIPMHGDRMIRLRTLEEVFADFDRNDSENGEQIMGYFVQVKPKHARQAQTLDASSESHTPQAVSATASSMAVTNAGAASNAISPDGIYLPDGKLNTAYLLSTAETLYESRDYSLARNIYKALLQSGEKNSVAHLGLARCFEAEGKLEEAKINYEESIAYHPHAEAYRNLTALLIRQGKDQEAAETIERVLHHRQLDEVLRYELHKTAGNCWSRLGNARESDRHYKKALEIRPQADDIQSNLGALYFNHGRVADAERYFQEALNVNPRNHQALTGLGCCATSQGRNDLALNWFACSLQIELKNPAALFHLIKCAYSTKNYAAAVQITENNAQVAPVNVHLLYSLAGLQYHVGKLSSAKSTCLKIQQIEPDHAGAKELIQKIEGINPTGC